MYLSEKTNDKINYLVKLHYLINKSNYSPEAVISLALHHSHMFATTAAGGTNLFTKPYHCGEINKIRVHIKHDLIACFDTSIEQSSEIRAEIEKYENDHGSELTYKSKVASDHDDWIEQNKRVNESSVGTAFNLTEKAYELIKPILTADNSKDKKTLNDETVRFINAALDFNIYTLSRDYIGIGLYELSIDGEWYKVAQAS